MWLKIYMRLVLDQRLVCDLELLCNGSFAPLKGFLNQADYQSVVAHMTLADGSLWPIPIVLPVTEAQASQIEPGHVLELCDQTNLPLARLTVETVYQPDLEHECREVYGDSNHPYTQIVHKRRDQGLTFYVGGSVEAIRDVPHCDFNQHRYTPAQIQSLIKRRWADKPVVAFQTRNPMHRSHFELTKYALAQAGTGSKLLLQPIVGVTQECDIDYFTRVKCYIELIKKYPKDTAVLSLLPLSMRMAGPREALWHALIRNNYGATHFVVGRDHAGPSCKNLQGEPFYDPYGAHQLLEKVADRLKIKIIKSKLIVYVSSLNQYLAIDKVPEEHRNHIQNISGTEQRRLLSANLPIPSWFSFPEIIAELKKSVISVKQQGLCIYLVGLSGSGKTTISKHLEHELKFLLNNGRKITVLDGDVVRQNLSKGLGFSRVDRSTNVRRIGYVASEIVKHNGVVICANIAPYEDDRHYNRDIISAQGDYIEVFVNTPVSVCAERDVKGLYKKAQRGEIKLTGVNDPFEVPDRPELELEVTSIDRQVGRIVDYIVDKGFL